LDGIKERSGNRVTQADADQTENFIFLIWNIGRGTLAVNLQAEIARIVGDVVWIP
jgi:hypothetical protein